ncbi:phosphate-starvation-inducible PsiE family protein [Vibrio sp. B172a]|uniref:phosphate-starvation-inducible PsiE family protein n=1 Tax=Vibrio sp. B172a TaxID=2835790 RepID=UPI0025562BCB|nr:phosphate-starvation-inducible PsiE family protein [Vibrio sp. B172a]MDK9783718.1 phosphate-starvation-inducible PsiE family protein [Vibrio sp. B172a]
MKVYVKSLMLKSFAITEFALVSLIVINTVFSVYYEGVHLFSTRQVTLTDILLLFLYLEVLAMVKEYIVKGKVALKYPLYIAAMSIARYVVLSIKELSTVDMVWLSLSILLISVAVIGLEFKNRLKIS